MTRPPLTGLVRKTMADYHADPALSRSVLDRIAKSPKHLRHYVEHGVDETAAMMQGRALHTLVLERERFPDEVAVFEGASRYGKAWDAFESKHAGKVIVLAKELIWIKGAALAIMTKPAARAALEDAVVEACAFATFDGVEVKARPDAIGADGIIYDLKSTIDASLGGFERQAYNLGYHRQAAWYLDVVSAATGWTPKGFAFIAVEKDEPYEAQTFQATEGFIARGRAENRANLARYRACLARGEWPGYPDAAQPLGLPGWLQ